MFCRHFHSEGEGGRLLNKKIGRRVNVQHTCSKHTSKIKSSYSDHLCLSSSHIMNSSSFLSETLPLDAFLGPVPSESEVQNAITTLQQVFGSASAVQHARNTCNHKLDNEVGHVTDTCLFDRVSSDGSETDWKEPSLVLNNPRMLQANVYDKVTFAVHLLQSDTCVQRMVKSLSSDKFVWDAVLDNEAVRELRKEIIAERSRSSNGTVGNDSPHTKNVFSRISDSAKAKLMEAMEKIIKMVKKLFQSAHHCKAPYAEKSNSFKDRLRVSVMLSIVIFLMVVVGRLY